MINLAFKGRLLLRPPHQRTVLIGTVYKPLVLSRAYSESHPLPKDSGSIQSSQSSRHEDKDQSKARDYFSKAWDQIPRPSQVRTILGVGSLLGGIVVVRACLFYVPFGIC